MTYDQHEARKRQVLDFHQRLSIERKQECQPKTDIRPLIFVMTRDKTAYQGSPGPLTWDYIGGDGVFAGRGMTSMLIAYAESVIELMVREDVEPVLVIFSNEGYVKTWPVEDADNARDELREHQLGDFAKEFREQAGTGVREALMTNVISFPTEGEDDDEPTYSSVVQPFTWTDGGRLVLDPIPEERDEGELARQNGGLLMIGHKRSGEDSNHNVMIKMIWDAVRARREHKAVAQTVVETMTEIVEEANHE